MASYDDLTLYASGTSAQRMLKVGWLGGASSFPTGDTPQETEDGLGLHERRQHASSLSGLQVPAVFVRPAG
jgi:hypothetical protein